MKPEKAASPAALVDEILTNPAVSPITKIKLLRAIHGETIKDLAVILGRSYPTIYKNLSGERDSMRFRREISRHYGMDPAVLFPDIKGCEGGNSGANDP